MVDRTPDEEATNELLLTWVIPRGGTIVVAGGYSGVAAAMLAERYPDAVLSVFEPQLAHYEALEVLFEHSPQIVVLPAALGERFGSYPMMAIGSDAASFVGAGPFEGKYQMVEWELTIVPPTALFYCNIEGYEHVLIPHLIDTGQIESIDQLAIQVHADVAEGVPSAEWRMRLGETHDHIWAAPLGDWHGWRRR